MTEEQMREAVQALERTALMLRVAARSLRAGHVKPAAVELSEALKTISRYLDAWALDTLG